jgi:peptide/nickel transport system permease protein
VIVRHAVRNALLPVITLAAIQLGTLLGGAVITESVFGLPGVGRYVIDAIRNRDYPIVQAVIVLIAGIYVILNLLVDLIYGWVDPRPAFLEQVTMAAAAAATAASPLDLSVPRRSGWAHGLRSFIRRKPLGVIGAVMLLCMVFVAVTAPLLAPFNPLEFHASDAVQPPNSTYKLGTDEKGRDILSRIMYGAQISLKVGVIAVGLGTTFGLVVGLVSGYIGGRFDFFSQRVVDSFQALPALFLALAVTTALSKKEWGIPGFGPDATKVGIALALATWAGASRVVRSSVLAQKQVAYVEAARSSVQTRASSSATPAAQRRLDLHRPGDGGFRRRPSGGGRPLLPRRGRATADALLGRHAAGGAAPVTRAPWMVIFPGIAISVAVFGQPLQ